MSEASFSRHIQWKSCGVETGSRGVGPICGARMVPLVSGAMVALAAAALSGHSAAQRAGLEGTWSGGGTVTFSASGARERARCRANFSRSSETTYMVRASCATPSGRVTQTAEVSRTAENRYRGSFYNPEYDASGTISIVVHGRSQTVRLTGDKGSALLNLSR